MHVELQGVTNEMKWSLLFVEETLNEFAMNNTLRGVYAEFSSVLRMSLQVI